MKKRFLALTVSLLIILLNIMPVCAVEGESYIFDDTGMLPAEALEKLEAQAEANYNQTGMVTAFVLTDTVEELEDYAEDFYEDRYGESSGILMAATSETIYLHLEEDAEDILDTAAVEALYDAYKGPADYEQSVAAYLNQAGILLGLQNDTPSVTKTSRVEDTADILTSDEEKALAARLDEVSLKHNVDVAVVTVDSFGSSSPEAFADDTFDYGGYGLGSEDSGILLALSMSDRQYALSTHEKGYEALTADADRYMMGKVLPLLGEDRYFDAFMMYADCCDEIIGMYLDGTPYKEERLPFFAFLPSGIIVGAIISLFMKKAKRKSLKNVRFKSDATGYAVDGSMKVVYSNDSFISKHINTTSKNTGGSGGGSNTRRSSSGRTHGGSSGGF